MMATRRWLIAQYDRSGQAKKLYTSEKTLLLTILRTSLLPLVLLVIYHFITGGKHPHRSSCAEPVCAGIVGVDHCAAAFCGPGFAPRRNCPDHGAPCPRRTASLASIPLGAYLEGVKDFAVHFFSKAVVG